MRLNSDHPAVPGAQVADRLRAGFADIRTELGVPTEHPADARSESQERAADPLGPLADVDLVGASDRRDDRAVPFVTLDPLSSTDLDQAFFLEPAADDGFVVHYAIADVAAHVIPGGAIDTDAQTRGQTMYAPDRRTGLHPPALAENAGSLLPEVDRLAVHWTLTIDARGDLIATDVRRAIVRSRAKLDYASAQAQLDVDEPHEQIAALVNVGTLLADAQRRRGAIELPDPAQELTDDGAAGWTLRWEPRHPIEAYNAQLSLLCGRAAARLMLDANVGLLRTLPSAPADAHRRLRQAARALTIGWNDSVTLAEFLPQLDGTNPRHLAFFDECRTLLRGADYTAFDGAAPALAEHAALVGAYAHVTAPLRRLADRYATECALAAHHRVAVPAWARDALPGMSAAMSAGSRRANALHRACIDLSEALLLEHRVGERFAAAIVDTDTRGADCRLQDPPILARCDGTGLRAGVSANIVLAEADPVRRTVRFRADGA